MNVIGLALLATCAVGCKKNDNDAPATSTNKTTGFVINGLTRSNTAIVKYVEELPADGER